MLLTTIVHSHDLPSGKHKYLSKDLKLEKIVYLEGRLTPCHSLCKNSAIMTSSFEELERFIYSTIIPLLKY
jgi:hypothetical protein